MRSRHGMEEAPAMHVAGLFHFVPRFQPLVSFSLEELVSIPITYDGSISK